MTDFQMVGLVLICFSTMLSIFKYLDHLKSTRSWTYLFSGFVRIGRGEYQLPKVDTEVIVIIQSESTGRFRYDLASMDGLGKWNFSKNRGKSFNRDKELIVAWAPLEEPFDGEYP
jgi:hypothetical protein